MRSSTIAATRSENASSFSPSPAKDCVTARTNSCGANGAVMLIARRATCASSWSDALEVSVNSGSNTDFATRPSACAGERTVIIRPPLLLSQAPRTANPMSSWRSMRRGREQERLRALQNLALLALDRLSGCLPDETRASELGRRHACRHRPHTSSQMRRTPTVPGYYRSTRSNRWCACAMQSTAIRPRPAAIVPTECRERGSGAPSRSNRARKRSVRSAFRILRGHLLYAGLQVGQVAALFSKYAEVPTSAKSPGDYLPGQSTQCAFAARKNRSTSPLGERWQKPQTFCHQAGRRTKPPAHRCESPEGRSPSQRLCVRQA